MKKLAEQKQLAFLWSLDEKKRENKTMILICTYSMLSFSGKRAEEARVMMDFIQSNEWGLMLLDEVQ